jgi:hypothetical protein
MIESSNDESVSAGFGEAGLPPRCPNSDGLRFFPLRSPRAASSRAPKGDGKGRACTPAGTTVRSVVDICELSRHRGTANSGPRRGTGADDCASPLDGRGLRVRHERFQFRRRVPGAGEALDSPGRARVDPSEPSVLVGGRGSEREYESKSPGII